MTSQNDDGRFFFLPRRYLSTSSYHDIIGNIFSGQIKSEIDKDCWALNLEPGLPAPFLIQLVLLVPYEHEIHIQYLKIMDSLETDRMSAGGLQTCIHIEDRNSSVGFKRDLETQ